MKLRFATVCASNQNRSMEAHAAMEEAGLSVCSYGAGYAVKLPGPSFKEPNVYKFGTSYRFMLEDLQSKDTELYKKNGLLRMLSRNMKVKEAPQKWQDNHLDGPFDVIITFEERVFDIVNEDLLSRDQHLCQCALVINLEVRDTHEEAASGAKLAVELSRMDPSDVTTWTCQDALKFCHRMAHQNTGEIRATTGRQGAIPLLVAAPAGDSFAGPQEGSNLPGTATSNGMAPCLRMVAWISLLEACKCWENDVDEVVMSFEREYQQKLLYNVTFY